MYSKDQASHLKQQFWTTFGKYIAPHLSAEGLKINWINYKTGIKHLHFKMDADKHHANIAIEINHPDEEIQQYVFEQFKAYKTLLESAQNEQWTWALHTHREGKTISRIYTELFNVNVFSQEDWPLLISFFKPRIIALDEFWTDAQYGFDLFR